MPGMENHRRASMAVRAGWQTIVPHSKEFASKCHEVAKWETEVHGQMPE